MTAVQRGLTAHGAASSWLLIALLLGGIAVAVWRCWRADRAADAELRRLYADSHAPASGWDDQWGRV